MIPRIIGQIVKVIPREHGALSPLRYCSTSPENETYIKDQRLVSCGYHLLRLAMFMLFHSSLDNIALK